MLRMKSTLSLALRARPFHTAVTMRAEREGVFGRFNPWAKKAQKAQESPVKDTAAASPISPIAPAFDVSFEEEESTPSWKNKELVQDPESIEAMVRSIVLEHVKEATDASWKEWAWSDPNVKFKIVKESIKQVGKEVPNLELNNMTSPGDLLDFLKRKEQDKTKSSIHAFFEENADSLPTNLTFEPSKKVRL